MEIWDEYREIDEAAWRKLAQRMNTNTVRNSLAQFMKTRIRPIHISKPIQTIMVPSGPWPSAALVQKTVLGQGVTYVGGASRIVLRGHGKSVRRAGKKRRRELK